MIPTPTPVPSVSFPPPPTNVPTNNSWRPSPGPGETNQYIYGGGADPDPIVESWVRPPVTVSPIPSPNPTVSGALGWTAATISNVTQGGSFNGQNGLVQYATTETDTGFANIFNVVVTTSNTYYQYVKNGSATSVFILGGNASREAGTPDATNFTTIYGKGNGLVDVVPEPTKTGQDVNVGPANNAALTTTEKDADGQFTTLAINADGTYAETVTYPDGTHASAQEALSAGSPVGTYSFPLGGDPGGQNSSVQIQPVAGGQIPFIVTYGRGIFPGQGPKVIKGEIPSWYPTLPVVLASETYKNFGPTALPNPFPTLSPVSPTSGGACNLGSDINGNLLKALQGKPYSNKLVQSDTKVDALFGEVETITTSAWITIGLGLTCSDTFDTVTDYYDYSGQSATVPLLSPTPVQVTTTELQIGINQATIFGQTYKFQNGGRRQGQAVFPAGSGQARGQRSALAQKQAQAQTRGGAGVGSNVSTGQLSPAQQAMLQRIVTTQVMHRFAMARVERHAKIWRKLKTMHFKRLL
jgi:hypothetical protein